MIIEQTLIKIGFDEKEAKVYLALLELGMEKVHAIAKKAEIKRPTAYIILEQLYSKNFVIKTYHKKKIFYSAEKPDILLRSHKQKEELLSSILPLLQARMDGGGKARPKIRIFEEKGGIEQIYDEIYQSPSVCFFGSIKNLSEEFDGLTDKLIKIIRHKDISVRDLVTSDPKDIDFAAAAVGKNYEARIVPKDMEVLTDGVIFGDKVAILSIKKDLFAVVIESKEVAATFKTFFELAWKSAAPFKQ